MTFTYTLRHVYLHSQTILFEQFPCVASILGLFGLGYYYFTIITIREGKFFFGVFLEKGFRINLLLKNGSEIAGAKGCS